MTEAQKDVIREECKVLSMAAVGRRYGYTRERIRQICRETTDDPTERRAGRKFEQKPMPENPPLRDLRGHHRPPRKGEVGA